MEKSDKLEAVPQNYKRPYNLIRKSIHQPEEVLPHVIFVNNKNERHKRAFNGCNVSMSSKRLQVFADKGLKCCKCRIEGKFFAVEKYDYDKGWHMNLYALDSNGDEVLMTKDHVMPKSKGGSEDLANFETMCANCNNHKSDVPEWELDDEFLKKCAIDIAYFWKRGIWPQKAVPQWLEDMEQCMRGKKDRQDAVIKIVSEAIVKMVARQD